MAKFVANNIDWNIDIDDILTQLEDMTAEAAAEALEIPKEHYANMTTSERNDYALDYFHHRNGAAAEFMGLPDEVEIPERFGIQSTSDDMSDVTDWLSDEYGFCINTYNVDEL